MRFLTCPLLGVLARLPPGGRLLDLGAGHGAFALLAVRSGAASAAVAVEPDRRKVLSGARLPGVWQVVGYADAVTGRFPAVSVIDVLYRLPLRDWDPFLRAALSLLEPGGVLLLKEIDPTRRLKGGWNRMQERLVDLMGLTLGEAFSYEAPALMRRRLERLGFTSIEVIDLGRGYPHAHVLYLARREPPGSPA